MTFRPSVLPDRDNNITDTFIRSFERARQLRRADQADARATAEFGARQEDREARKDEALFNTRLEIARDPELTTLADPTTRGFRQQVGATAPAGSRISGAFEAVGEISEQARPSLGEIPGTDEEVFFDPGGRERAIREDAALERDIARPDRQAEEEARAAERTEIGTALREAGVSEAEIRVLIRNPDDARQRLQSLSAQEGRTGAAEAARGTTTTGGERERTANIQAIITRAGEVGKPITDAQAAIFEANPDQFEDFLRPVPLAQQEAIMSDLDRMQDVLDDIESDELTNIEKLERKKRALIDGGFLGTTEAFSVGLARFQDARREAREMAGTSLETLDTPAPGAGPAADSGLGGDEAARTISSTQVPAIAAAIEDLSLVERNEALDRLAPGATAADRAAIMRAAGTPPTP